MDHRVLLSYLDVLMWISWFGFPIWMSYCGFHGLDFLSGFPNVDFGVWISYLDFRFWYFGKPLAPTSSGWLLPTTVGRLLVHFCSTFVSLPVQFY